MRGKILLIFGLLFIALHAVAQTPEDRLQELVGTWKCVESTFSDPPEGICKVVSVANENAVYSTWTQGRDSTYYEANALWGYSKSAKQVRVFEVNTIGAASTHIGNFNEKEELVLELRSPVTNKLLEERIFTWTADTWRMKARLVLDGEEQNHHITLIKLRD